MKYSWRSKSTAVLCEVIAALVLGFASSEAQSAELPSLDASPEMTARETGAESDSPTSDPFREERLRMVEQQLVARGIRDERVLEAIRSVPRHAFVSEALQSLAYADRPLPIGEHQTISQPYIVAIMSELAKIDRDDRVLEIGTGSGYQAAVLAELAAAVFSIEIIETLAIRARRILSELGYGSLHLRTGDGYRGWPEAAPFDAIVITAAPPRIPEPLLEQLAVGGRLVVPVGRNLQQLVVVTRTEAGFERETVLPVRFVPMTGEVQRNP